MYFLVCTLVRGSLYLYLVNLTPFYPPLLNKERRKGDTGGWSRTITTQNSILQAIDNLIKKNQIANWKNWFKSDIVYSLFIQLKCAGGRKENFAVKALLQRVTGASVTVDGNEVGRIGRGLVVFIGLAAGDTERDVSYLARKTVELRIFADEEGKFNRSARDVGGELLVISQFTLLADTRKGRRPSFTGAAPPEEAGVLFEEFVERVRASGLKVETGLFQSYMQVEIHNDGPVTLMLDSRDKF